MCIKRPLKGKVECEKQTRDQCSVLLLYYASSEEMCRSFYIGGMLGVELRAGKTVIGQRRAPDHLPSSRKLRDGTVAVCLSPQMTAN